MITFKRIRYMIYFLSLFFIWTWVKPYSETVIDPQLKPYYLEYITIVEEYCTKDQYLSQDFKLIFDDTGDNRIAYCQNFPNAFKIVIDEKRWKIMSEDNRFSNIAHEFSHCHFEIPHFDYPKHFMYYANTFVPKNKVKEQLIEILKYKCGSD